MVLPIYFSNSIAIICKGLIPYVLSVHTRVVEFFYEGKSPKLQRSMM